MLAINVEQKFQDFHVASSLGQVLSPGIQAMARHQNSVGSVREVRTECHHQILHRLTVGDNRQVHPSGMRGDPFQAFQHLPAFQWNESLRSVVLRQGCGLHRVGVQH